MIKLESLFHGSEFIALGKKFNLMLKDFSPQEKCFKIADFFPERVGISGTIKKLFDKKIIESKKDFQGIYVFLKQDVPFYVGISQHVIQRIHQHVKGKNHFSSSLCYRLGSEFHLTEKGFKHTGGRAGLDFRKYVEPYKKELMDCDVAIYQVNDFLELYLFEVFVAMELGTLYYNCFKTH